MIPLGYVSKYLYVIFGNPIRKANNMHFTFLYLPKSAALMKKYNIISFILFKEMSFFYLVIKLISRLKLYEKRQRDAKMLNVEMRVKCKLDLLKNIVVYEIELKHLDELACASTNHFNNISNNSSIPTIIFVSIPYFSLYKSKKIILISIRAKFT